MAKNLTEKTIQERIEQLDKWNLDLFDGANSQIARFLAYHWEDTLEIVSTLDENGRWDLFMHLIPVIGQYITEENWPSVVKGIIAMKKTTKSSTWPKFNNIKGIIDARTMPYVIALAKIPGFLETVECADMLPGEQVNDIKNCLGPEWVKILQSIQYIPEALLLLPFMKNRVRVFLQNNINIVYALDKSGRILGFLFFCVLSNMGLSKKAKFYFMNVADINNKKVGILYSEKQKKDLAGKNVLLIDEYIQSGKTLAAAYSLLSELVGKQGKVIPAVFSMNLINDQEGNARSMVNSRYHELRAYHAVTWILPSWYLKNEFTGVNEMGQGPVGVDKGSLAIATEVRRAFSKYGKMIAAYLKENMRI